MPPIPTVKGVLALFTEQNTDLAVTVTSETLQLARLSRGFDAV